MASGFIRRRLGFRTKRYGGAKRQRTFTAEVKKIIDKQVDKKFIVVAHSALTTTMTNGNPASTFLNPLVQGVTDNTRLGDRIKAKYLLYNFFIYGPAGASCEVAYALIRTKDPRGVAPSYTQIFNTATPAPDDNFNHSTVDWNNRFECLKRGTVHIQANYSTQVQTQMRRLKIDLKDAISDYSISNAGSVADVDKNAYYMLFYTDSGSNTTVYHAYQFYFVDM